MIDNRQQHEPGPERATWHEGHFAAWHGGPHHSTDRVPERIHGHNRHGFFGGQHGARHFGGRRGGWGGHGGHGGRGGHGGHGGFGGRDRLERGLLRYVILDLLRDGPKHGYEIIKQLEERTGGRYSPSPGTLYPTLQFMEDLGLVRSDQEEGRRVYQLTDTGRADLEEHLSLTEHFWTRFQGRAPSGAILQEINFLRDALNDLTRTVSGSLRSAIFATDTDTVRRVRQVLERAQNEVREIVAQGAAAKPSAGEAEESGQDNPDAADDGPQVTRSL